MIPVLASVPTLLSDIGLAILVATALAFLARAAKQPLLLAYVVAGVVLGPSVGFAVIDDAGSVEAISSIGLILLLYLIGLEIDVQAIRRSGKAVILSGVAQAPLNLLLCLPVPLVLATTGVLGPLGESGLHYLYLAFGLAVSSTLVVVKSLYDKSELDTLPGRITLGVLVFQDLWAILFLAVQPSFAHPQLGPLFRSLGLGAAVIVGAFLSARYVLPPVFRGAARVPELLILGAIAWCFLVAGLAAQAGLSAEMGALTAGLAMSFLPYKADVVAKVSTVRDFFLTLFFVALGLKVAAPTVALGVAAVVVALWVLATRFLVMFPLLRAMRLGDRASLVVPMNLWPVSEFSLVLAAIGVAQGDISRTVLDVLLFTMILSSVAGTYLIAATHPIYLSVQRFLDRRGWSRKAGAASAEDASHDGHGKPIVLLGFHRIASALLSDLQRTRPDLVKDVLVVDFNPVVLDGLKRRGVACAYGDLAHPDSLQHAGIAGCKVAVCTIPDTLFKGTTNRRLLSVVKGLSPDAKVVVTAETAALERDLLAAGAAAILVPQRAAGASGLADVLALLEGRPPPSSAASAESRDEVLP